MSVKILEAICSETDLHISMIPEQSVDTIVGTILQKVDVAKILKESSGEAEGITGEYYKMFAAAYAELAGVT